MQFILFLCVFFFISNGALIWGRCQRFVSGLIIMGIWRAGRLLRWGLEVVPAIKYHCNAVLMYGRIICLRNKNEKQCIIAELFASCHRPIKFITEPRSGSVINSIGRWHEANSRLGDKFDRSMTRGKLLGNNALLLIIISILIMTQLISFLWKNENKKFTRLAAVRTGGLGLLPVR